MHSSEFSLIWLARVRLLTLLRSSNISKPTLDLILFNVQLGRSIGARGSMGLFVSYIATAWILRKVTPAFGKLAAIEAKLEGDFRNAHSRLIINAEEIA